MSNFDFKKVLRENIEKREESNKNDKEDLNEFVRDFFKPKFGTNLASLKSQGDKEESEEEVSLELEPGEFYVIKIGDKKDDVGYGRVAKGADIDGDEIPVDRIQLTNVDKEMMDLSDKPEMLDRKAFIRKADKEDQKADQFNESAASSIVDSNADLIAMFLKSPDRSANGKVKMLFKPFFEKSGIPFKGGSAVDDILDLMRQVATNKKIRSKLASLAAKQNESEEVEEKTEQLFITEGLLDKLKNFFATNKKPDNEKLAKIEKLVRTIESGNYRTNLPSNDVEDIFKLARQTLDRDNE